MRRKTKAVLGIVAMSSMVLSLGMGAYACETTVEEGQRDQTNQKQERTSEKNEYKKGWNWNQKTPWGNVYECFKEMKRDDLNVDQLVTAGLLNEEVATSIKTFITVKDAEILAEKEKVETMTPEEQEAYFAARVDEEKVGLLDDLVLNKILTQEQADAIHEYVQAQRLEKQQIAVTATLESFVTNDTITQVQADAILEEVKVQLLAWEADQALLDTMTNGERVAYFKERLKQQPLATLVSDGTITQEQADIIFALTGYGSHGRNARNGRCESNDMK